MKKKMHVKSRQFKGIKKIIFNNKNELIRRKVNITNHAISLQEKSIIFCIERNAIFD